MKRLSISAFAFVASLAASALGSVAVADDDAHPSDIKEWTKPLPGCKMLRDEELKVLETRLSAIEAVVPRAPDAEAAYLRKEADAARRANNAGDSRRLLAVRQRPYFAALELHDAILKAQQLLWKMEALSPKISPKVRIKMATDMIDRVRMVEFGWNDFETSSFGKALHPDVRQQTHIRMLELTGAPGDYIDCWADAISGN